MPATGLWTTRSGWGETSNFHGKYRHKRVPRHPAGQTDSVFSLFDSSHGPMAGVLGLGVLIHESKSRLCLILLWDPGCKLWFPEASASHPQSEVEFWKVHITVNLGPSRNGCMSKELGSGFGEVKKLVGEKTISTQPQGCLPYKGL